MDFSLSDVTELAPDQAYEAFRDWLPDLVQVLSSVAGFEVAHREQHDAGPHVVDRWRFGEPVPRIMRPFFPDPAIFVERARWDDADRSAAWELELEGLPGVVECRGSTQLRPGPRAASTEILLTGSLAIDLLTIDRMPRVLQGLAAEAERWVLDRVRSDLSVLCRSLPRLLEHDPEQAAARPVENP